MRLEKIKLSGFKSFVDPTTIPFPGNLIGIVGPNGCGKSNIIDAVRWVMGESSARHLRGTAMADVIFNGAVSRKPVGMAAVELVFDNSAGRLGGEYAQYNQISIKRQVSRDGQSNYLMNGSRCRRKDITDIFLGTGLGPKSYAIIEQGTISRLIEAKPDELRAFIEEAAGISKYKERRHETEIRMRHTRENLDRLEDLREEIAKQLAHLQKQAEKAEEYKALKQEERRYRQELLALRWRQQDRIYQKQYGQIQQKEREWEGLSKDCARFDQALQQAHKQHKEQQQRMNEAQERYYALSVEISRLDQAIKHAQKNRAELEKALERCRAECEQSRFELEQDRQQLEAAGKEKIAVTEALANAERVEAEALEQQRKSQRELQAWREEWEALQALSAQYNEQTEVQRARLQQFEQQARQLEARLARYAKERDELSAARLEEDLAALEQGIGELEKERRAVQDRLQAGHGIVREERRRLREGHDELAKIRSRLQHLEGKISSLKLLQQHAMGKDRSALKRWLEQLSLSSAPRLAERLEVQPGWELAVERVLGIYLEAVCLDDMERVAARLEDLSGQSAALFATRPRPETDQAGDLPRLLDQVRSPWNLQTLLGGVYCAEDLRAAKALCAKLAPHESVVTPDGTWLGPDWIIIRQEADERTGLLKREKELRVLNDQQRQSLAAAAQWERRLDEAECRLRKAEADGEKAQQAAHRLGDELTGLNAELSAQRAHAEHARRRIRQIEQELQDAQAAQLQQAEEMAEARMRLQESAHERGRLEERGRALTDLHERLSGQAEDVNTAASEARDRVQALKGRLDTLGSTCRLTQKHLERVEQHHRQSMERMEAIQLKLRGLQSPLQDEARMLHGLLKEREEGEKELAHLKQQLSRSEAHSAQLAQQQARLEEALARQKEQLDKARLALQECKVRRQAVQEQLQELAAPLSDLLEALPEQAEEKIWQSRLEKLNQRIESLGTVNLAAIEEHQEQAGRLSRLDQQRDDLMRSLATLEEAIRKIDRESRARFKETFDRVNEGLQKNFPKLFGGGQAYLQLDDRDMLESGVSVMARPPGKRNSSIHLLSGGEKALTAVALVFSIFELNPAPFCLLDEVDAPLDDANVGRFSQLVKEMSETVQFIFITHNKVTMEIAQHLTGVTMEEPGVSRLVAVDIEEAVELAAV